MANSTLIQLVQQAAGELGIPVPVSIAGNQALDVVQLYYLINGLGNDLMRQYIWQDLNRQYILTVEFTTITGDTTINTSNLTNCSSIVGIDTTYGISGAGINQACYVGSAPSGTTIPLSQPATSTNAGQTYTLTKVKYAMPSDYDRQIDRTHWDKTKHWEMLGPETAQQWEWLISGYISTGPRIRYRIFGDYFQIWPFTASAETIGFEYITKNWVFGAGSIDNTPNQSSFTLDTDTCMFSDRLMVNGLKLRYYDAKGLDSTALQIAFQSELDIAKANDAGSLTLSFAPQVSTILITGANIPDSGYGT
jgi:hypothetical protein